MATRKIKVFRMHKSLAILIPRQTVHELGLVHRQRMLFMPYKNGLKVIPLEPHQAVTQWTQVRNLCIKNRDRLRVVLPSAMCQTLGLKAMDVIKIKLDGPDGKGFFVLTRYEEFIADMALRGSPSIHLVASPVTIDGKVDETRPCIRKILPYADAAKILGGLESYDASDFAEGLEAHLRMAGPPHGAPPETVRTVNISEPR